MERGKQCNYYFNLKNKTIKNGQSVQCHHYVILIAHFRTIVFFSGIEVGSYSYFTT